MVSTGGEGVSTGRGRRERYFNVDRLVFLLGIPSSLSVELVKLRTARALVEVQAPSSFSSPRLRLQLWCGRASLAGYHGIPHAYSVIFVHLHDYESET